MPTNTWPDGGNSHCQYQLTMVWLVCSERYPRYSVSFLVKEVCRDGEICRAPWQWTNFINALTLTVNQVWILSTIRMVLSMPSEGITSKNDSSIIEWATQTLWDGLFQNIPGNKDQHLFASVKHSLEIRLTDFF